MEMLWQSAELLEEPLLAGSPCRRCWGSMSLLEQAPKYLFATGQRQVGHAEEKSSVRGFYNMVVFPFLCCLEFLLV